MTCATIPATPIESGGPRRASRTRRRRPRRLRWQFGHSQSDLADSSEQTPQGSSHFHGQILLQQRHGQGIEGLDVLVERVTREVGEPF